MGLKIKLDLFAPGMTDLHRAGLAGLYMTLAAFKQQRVMVPGVTWSLSPRSVTLGFDGCVKAAMSQLFQMSFQLDSEGYIRLPALERDGALTSGQKQILHESLMSSFLQHGQHRKVGPRKASFYLINDKPVKFEMSPVLSYRHQQAVDFFFYEDSDILRDEVCAAGWLYPGCIEKHSGLVGETLLRQAVPLALCLVYAPVGCIYFRVLSHFRQKKVQLCLIIPSISNLAEYAEYRRVNGDRTALKLTAASVSDAVLTHMVGAALRHVAPGRSQACAPSCRVFGLGKVSWNVKQKTRSMVRSYRWSNSLDLKNYDLAMSLFRTRLQLANAAEGVDREVFFVAPSVLRELVADNIVEGRRWYHGVAGVASARQYSGLIRMEAKELGEMAIAAKYETAHEKTFLDLCYAAWSGHVRRIGARASREGAAFGVMADREREKWRSQFNRVRTSRDLRSVCTAYFTKSGMDAGELKGGIGAMLAMVAGKDWSLAKDLAVLALASYRKNIELDDEDVLIVEED